MIFVLSLKLCLVALAGASATSLDPRLRPKDVLATFAPLSAAHPLLLSRGRTGLPLAQPRVVPFLPVLALTQLWSPPSVLPAVGRAATPAPPIQIQSNSSNCNTSSIKKPLSESENLLVGVVGGVVEVSALMPIITARFCLQQGRPLPRSFTGLYRGWFVQASNVAPIVAAQMWLNGVLEKGILSASSRTEISDGERISASAVAGALSAFLYSPVDLVCIHQQKLKKSLPQTVQHLRKQHGARLFLRGTTVTAGREAICVAGYLALAPLITQRLEHQLILGGTRTGRVTVAGEDQHAVRNEENAGPTLKNRVCGSCASGVAAVLLTHPLDTAKTVYQADAGGEKYRSSFSALRSLYAKGGWKSLFRGVWPRAVRVSGTFFVLTSLTEKAVRKKEEMGGLAECLTK